MLGECPLETMKHAQIIQVTYGVMIGINEIERTEASLTAFFFGFRFCHFSFNDERAGLKLLNY
jgi:hypothetical protein